MLFVIALSAPRGSCQTRNVGHAETRSTEAACTVGSRAAIRVAVRFVATPSIMHSNVPCPSMALSTGARLDKFGVTAKSTWLDDTYVSIQQTLE